MTQPLWYLRHAGRIVGPFPAPQVREFLQAGEVAPDWEASLDQIDWLTLRESSQFEIDSPARGGDESDAARRTWHQQREDARLRWLDDAGKIELADEHDKQHDDLTRNAIDADHDRTQTLVKQEIRRAPPLRAGMIALAILAVLGLAIWYGQQGGTTIQAGITKKANCATTLADGVDWSGCDKRDLAMPGASARNAHLDHSRIDNARLANADLSYAILTGASLRNADLQGVKLIGADLSGADLTGADLTGATLNFALLKGAVIEGTRLRGTRLDKAEWLDGRVCGAPSLGQCQ